MFAIYKRELRSYFITPIGYIFCGMFLLVSGILFYRTTLAAQSTESLGTYFIYLLLMFAILIPLLTMKLLADDRRSKTEQLLMTAPVSITGMVMGKYLAALTIYGCTFFVNIFNFILLYRYGSPNTASILANIFGVFLIDEYFAGDDREEGYVVCHSKWRIELRPDEARQILFWNYYANRNAPERIVFGSGLHRYLSDIRAAQILRDIIQVKKQKCRKMRI